MPTLEISLPAQWQYYNQRSHEAHHSRADHFAQGREEQLWETLIFIENGQAFTDLCRDRLDRLPQNRAKKHFRLFRRLAQMLPPITRTEASPVDVADDVEMVAKALLPNEMSVERRLAVGHTYSEIAEELCISADTLKVRVSRWRKRLRRKIRAI